MQENMIKPILSIFYKTEKKKFFWLTRRFAAFLVAWLILGSGLWWAFGADQTELAPDLDEIVGKSGFSGAILVARGDKVTANGYGLADFDRKVAITPRTRFAIGSLTKQFTAVAILQLAQEGKISLEDSLCRFINNCPQSWQPVTLYHLLTHTSGISEAGANQELLSGATTFEQVFAAFQGTSLVSRPGQVFSYNNTGYALLGYVTQIAAGKSYREYLKEEMFDPSGMSSTGFDCGGDCARGYRNGTPVEMPDLGFLESSGGLYSTVEDLYRWNQALDSGKLLRGEWQAQMFTLQAGDAHQGYGFGWYITRLEEHPYQYHGGILPGYNAFMARLPEDRTTVVVLSNQGNGDTGSAGNKLAAQALKDAGMEAVHPWVRLATSAAGAAVSLALPLFLLKIFPARKNFAWKRSAWLAGWLPLVGSAVTIAVGLAFNLDLEPLRPARLVETAVPLLAGLQAAYLLSPEDEPALEVLLACPRPASWLLLERVCVALGLQFSIALSGSLAVWFITGENPALLLLRWIPPTLFMAGFGVWVSQVTRQGLMGVGLSLFLCTGLLLGGDFLVNRYPWLWPLHLYMQPSEYYLLNRISLSLVGLALLLLALNRTRDEQHLLFGKLA